MSKEKITSTLLLPQSATGAVFRAAVVMVAYFIVVFTLRLLTGSELIRSDDVFYALVGFTLLTASFLTSWSRLRRVETICQIHDERFKAKGG